MNKDSKLIYEAYQTSKKVINEDQEELDGLPVGTKVEFDLYAGDASPEDWGCGETVMSQGENETEAKEDYTYPSWETLQTLDGLTATVDCLSVENDKSDKDANYYDITFANGVTLHAVSGYCLTPKNNL